MNKTIKRRKINVKNCYLLFVSVVALFSLMGNIFQDIYYNKALEIQEQTMETVVTEYYEVVKTYETAMLP